MIRELWVRDRHGKRSMLSEKQVIRAKAYVEYDLSIGIYLDGRYLGHLIRPPLIHRILRWFFKGRDFNEQDQT